MQHPFDFLLLPHVPLGNQSAARSSTLPTYPRYSGSQSDMQSDVTLEQLIIRWLVDPFYNFWFPTFPTVQPMTFDKRSVDLVNDDSWHIYISSAAMMNNLHLLQEVQSITSGLQQRSIDICSFSTCLIYPKYPPGMKCGSSTGVI